MNITNNIGQAGTAGLFITAVLFPCCFPLFAFAASALGKGSFKLFDAGKTTTIFCFLASQTPHLGEAKINDVTVKPNAVVTEKLVACVPEVVQLYGNLNGIENLDFFTRLAGFKYLKEELQKFLTKAGLQMEAHRKKLSTYSKGMRQKARIAITQ